MSNAVENMFASLSADADAIPVMSATTLRTRTNHRAAVQTSLAGFALVAVIAGTAVGGQWLLAGQNRTTNPPAGSVSATPTTTAPSPTPSATPSTPATPSQSIPASIPLAAFLSRSDLNDGTGLSKPSDQKAPVPSFCKARFVSDDNIGVRRMLRAFYRRPGSAADNVPDGTVRQSITVYKDAGAEQFMADVRAAVSHCAKETDQPNGPAHTYKLLHPVNVGDDSIRIQEQSVGPAAPDSTKLATFTQQISIVRVGSGVTVLWTGSYENDSAIDSTVVAMTRAAHHRMTAWQH